ncbi:amino acid adenylation domain-containing protein [Streptomyces sp. CA-250714]|uniref:non-ribosomal peptide synthetase n=1 Tax=Streptomyces sp. CA-250714 TaxID=3240060 RepID=UPI003D8A7186
MNPPDGERHDDVWQAVVNTAAQHPDLVALCDGVEEISYARLVAEAERRAAALHAHGLVEGDVVALCSGRSVQQVLAVAGILAAGGAVAPFPAQQAAGTTREAIARLAPRLVLAEKDADSLFPGALSLDLPEPAAPAPPLKESGPADHVPRPRSTGARSDRLAYVLHTSGSSGRPKAVHVPHSAVRNRFSWGQSLYPIGPEDTVLYAGSLVFDCQMWVVLAPLCYGATLLVAPEGAEAEPQRLAELAREHRVTVMHFVPSLLREFLAAGAGAGLAGLSYLLVAGERLPGELAAQIFASTGARVINQYGPTETCIDVLNHELTPQDAAAEAVPIGRPIAGVRAVVRDERGRPVPSGGTGELLLGGRCLAWGYGDPAQTAERFVPDDDPAHPGQRLYRTGDLVRDRGDGVYEFLGRVDHQVKIRGVRVEPSETEHALLRHPAVAQAVVVSVPDEGGEARLVAHVVAADAARGLPSEAGLRGFLLDRLPPAALPSAYHEHDALPRLRSGKIDRLALADSRYAPARQEPSAPGAPASDPPLTGTERAVAELWQDLLGTGPLGRAADYFELGGQSLLTMRMIARIRRRFGVRLPARTVFSAPTVALFAAAIDEAVDEAGNRSGHHAGTTPGPMTPEPVTTEPMTPESVTTDPVTAEPMTPGPMTTEPVAAESATRAETSGGRTDAGR